MQSKEACTARCCVVKRGGGHNSLQHPELQYHPVPNPPVWLHAQTHPPRQHPPLPAHPGQSLTTPLPGRMWPLLCHSEDPSPLSITPSLGLLTVVPPYLKG